MRIDWYTKRRSYGDCGIAGGDCDQAICQPGCAVAHAQGSFAGLQYSSSVTSFFDARTGDVWWYDWDGTGTGTALTNSKHFRQTKLGAPMAPVK